VYEFAEKNKMWIITRDADYQNIKKFNSYNVAGIILIKLTLTKTDYLLKSLKRFLDKYNDKLSEKSLIIIEDYLVRVY
jgi:predicted nuclease of predicted toxin-antitoxin system